MENTDMQRIAKMYNKLRTEIMEQGGTWPEQLSPRDQL